MSLDTCVGCHWPLENKAQETSWDLPLGSYNGAWLRG